VPLTIPDFTDPQQTCTVSVQSVQAGISTFATLTPDQVNDWSDQDLTDRVDALKEAIAAFLAPGQDLQVNVMWSSNATATA
jgi:hypothetical protein